MNLISIFGFSSTASAIIISVAATFFGVLIVLGIIIFVLVQKGMLKMKFSKATRTILGKPKKGYEVKPIEATPEVHKDLAPLKITVFDIKEERKKYETAQREAIKSMKTIKKERKTPNKKENNDKQS